jgi:hypothetical protein
MACQDLLSHGIVGMAGTGSRGQDVVEINLTFCASRLDRNNPLLVPKKLFSIFWRHILVVCKLTLPQDWKIDM